MDFLYSHSHYRLLLTNIRDFTLIIKGGQRRHYVRVFPLLFHRTTIRDCNSRKQTICLTYDEPRGQ